MDDAKVVLHSRPIRERGQVFKACEKKKPRRAADGRLIHKNAMLYRESARFSHLFFSAVGRGVVRPSTRPMCRAR